MRIFGHEVTNFNAPQKLTFFEKKLDRIFSFGETIEMWRHWLGKENPIYGKENHQK